MMFHLFTKCLAFLITVHSAQAVNRNNVLPDEMSTSTANLNFVFATSTIVPDETCIAFCNDYFSKCMSSNSYLNPTASEYASMIERKLIKFTDADQPRTSEVTSGALLFCQQTCMDFPRNNKDPGTFSFLSEADRISNDNLGGDTLACRKKHLSLADDRNTAAFHCPHATNPSTQICRDAEVNGYSPYELLRDGQRSRRVVSYCDLAGDDTIADCTDVGLGDDALAKTLSYLPDTIEVIFMSGNPGITTLGAGIFEDNLRAPENLQAIYFNNCGIASIHEDALSGLSNLKIFSMNVNPLGKLEPHLLDHTPELLQFEYFIAGVLPDSAPQRIPNHLLTSIPAEFFANTPKMERIIMYGHKGITGFSKGTFEGLHNLNIMSFVDCGITSLEDEDGDNLFDDLVNLQFFDFFGNSIAEFKSSWFNGEWERNLLRVTFWGQCGGITIDPAAFDNMDSLEAAYFHLNGNPEIDPSVFDDKENFIHLTTTGDKMDMLCAR